MCQMAGSIYTFNEMIGVIQVLRLFVKSSGKYTSFVASIIVPQRLGWGPRGCSRISIVVVSVTADGLVVGIVSGRGEGCGCSEDSDERQASSL